MTIGQLDREPFHRPGIIRLAPPVRGRILGASRRLASSPLTVISLEPSFPRQKTRIGIIPPSPKIDDGWRTPGEGCRRISNATPGETAAKREPRKE